MLWRPLEDTVSASTLLSCMNMKSLVNAAVKREQMRRDEKVTGFTIEFP